MNERRCVLTVADRVTSKAIESIRRNREENSTGLSVNKANEGQCNPSYRYAVRVAYPMLADVPES